MTAGDESGPGEDAVAVLRCHDGTMLTLPVHAAPRWPQELRISVQPAGGYDREWSDVARPRSLTAHVFHLAAIESPHRAFYDEP